MYFQKCCPITTFQVLHWQLTKIITRVYLFNNRLTCSGNTLYIELPAMCRVKIISLKIRIIAVLFPPKFSKEYIVEFTRNYSSTD